MSDVTADRRQVTPESGRSIARWCGGTWDREEHTITMHSREGTQVAAVGDWIVNAVPGHGSAFYVLTDQQARAQ